MFQKVILANLILANTLLAKPSGAAADSLFSEPFYLLFFLIGIALLPFLAVMTTSFAKIVVVLSIARQAMGTPQAPPNIVIMSLSILLCLFSMYPVLSEIAKTVDQQALINLKNPKDFLAILEKAQEPMRNYLARHATEENQQLFYSILTRDQKGEEQAYSKNDFIILAPAFLISDLTTAFQIGFLIYLPFLVIDMTVANLLMALGMQMLAPTTISLPFKILLFVLVDGWKLLAEGLAKV